jgi:hypothetical protein
MKRSMLLVGAMLFAAPAVAQPPPLGWVGALSQPSILCDTSDQVQSIVDAFAIGPERGRARFAALVATINDKNEPTCALTAVPLAESAGSTQLGVVRIGDVDLYGWIVRVRNGGAEGFYLHLETPEHALKNTI